MPEPSPGFTPQRLLRSLMHLRSFAIVSQLAVLAFALGYLQMQLPLVPMLTLIGFLAAWNLLTFWRLRGLRATGLTEVSVHLLIDSAVLTGLLYYGGGPANPFVSLYLVPIAIAATTLPTRGAWLITLACVLSYSLLFYLHKPLPHSHVGSAFDLHVLGMWANFILSAGLIAGFVSLLARAVRRRDVALASQREQGLRNEQILALATQAAGAAHELNTPLSTLAVVLGELRNDAATPVTLHADLDLMAQQVEQCRLRLRELVDDARAIEPRPQALDPLLEQLRERWGLLRPETDLQIDDRAGQVKILVDNSLPQALLNLLGNAADASAAAGDNRVMLTTDISQDWLIITIDDFGQGIDTLTTKPDGMGVGLALSNASIERLGGNVNLQNRPGGARATVKLPLLTA